MSGGTYSLTSTPTTDFSRNFFMAGLFTLRVFARNLLRGNRRRNIFISYFVLIPDLTHYLLDYGDFIFDNIYANQSNRFIKKVDYNNAQFEIYERTNIIRQPIHWARGSTEVEDTMELLRKAESIRWIGKRMHKNRPQTYIQPDNDRHRL